MDDKVTIEIKEDGPLIAKGLKEWQNSRGEDLPVKETMSLCRCGASSNKPFCDGSHVVVGFSGKREIAKPLHKEREYVGGKITIHDNRRICSHAAECVDRLPRVFRKEGRPWIEPDGDDVEKIIDVIERCPSGALSYTIDGVHHRDQERRPAILIDRDGPYNVVGGIELQVPEALQPPSREHYSLCRCGASKNKPYCDGSHSSVGFKDDKNWRQ